jgi:hypothetical protein
MVYFTLADAPQIQTIPYYISNPLRNLALVKDNKDDSFIDTAGSIYPAPTDSKKGFV